MSIARQQAYVQDVRNWSVCRPSCHGELSVVIMWCQLQASSSLTRQTIEAEAKGSHHIDCFVRSAIVGALLPFITTVTTIVRNRGLTPNISRRSPTQLLLKTMLPTRKRCSAYLGLLTAAAILVQQHRHVAALPGKTLTSSTMNQRLAGMEYAVVSPPGG